MENVRVERNVFNNRVMRILTNEGLTADVDKLSVGDVEVKPVRIVAERMAKRPVPPRVGMVWQGTTNRGYTFQYVVCSVNDKIVYFTSQLLTKTPAPTPAPPSLYDVSLDRLYKMGGYPHEEVKEKYWKDL